MTEIKDLQPSSIWRHFYALTRVPRPSGHVEKVQQFLLDFARETGVEAFLDKAGNVVMRKAATPGMENRKTVTLQAHMDMVPQKLSDSPHNFETDPIEAYVDGEWVKARGTTLGADNGIGVATELAILASDDLKHPRLECLFTVDEETGLTGASAIDPGLLKGSMLINLDSEDDGEFFIGCAGGMNTTATFRYEKKEMPAGLFYFEVKVSGLKGGHSGGDIHLNRGNANKILSRFLWQTMKETDLKLSLIEGGNLHNAIPREARAVCAVPMDYKETLRVEFNHFTADIEGEFAIADSGVRLSLESCDRPSHMIDDCTTKRLLYSLVACPHGVQRMSDEMPGIVETSTNLAAIKMTGNDSILITTSQRSSVESSKKDIARTVESVFALAGAEVEHSEGYPGWKPNPKSPIANIVASTYEKLFGKKAKIIAIHAGLECGLFLEKYPHLDMVSVGPTMRGVHSPDEQLHIGDTQKFWQLIVHVLENI